MMMKNILTLDNIYVQDNRKFYNLKKHVFLSGWGSGGGRDRREREREYRSRLTGSPAAKKPRLLRRRVSGARPTLRDKITKGR